LARKDVRSVGLIGAGYQAPWQLEAVCEVRPQIREILVFDIDQERARAFAKRMGTFLSRFHVRIIQIESSEEAVRERDIIVTVTTSTTPVFDGNWLREGTHINAVGSFTPEMQELDETTIIRAEKIVTDVREDALEMAGDLIKPIRRGVVPEDVIYCEIGEILSGKKPGREREDEITLFESVSMSALDVAVARTIHRNAMRMGFGRQMDLN
jgi:ornithine cyclodeaminase/alanine dehydrogenase-like protein (mu-crystallin family)